MDMGVFIASNLERLTVPESGDYQKDDRVMVKMSDGTEEPGIVSRFDGEIVEVSLDNLEYSAKTTKDVRHATAKDYKDYYESQVG